MYYAQNANHKLHYVNEMGRDMKCIFHGQNKNLSTHTFLDSIFKQNLIWWVTYCRGKQYLIKIVSFKIAAWYTEACK